MSAECGMRSAEWGQRRAGVPPARRARQREEICTVRFTVPRQAGRLPYFGSEHVHG